MAENFYEVFEIGLLNKKMNTCLQRLFCCAKALPLIFILLIVGWSYYAYVVAMCIYSVPAANIGEKAALIIVYHMLFVMFVWAYIQTTFAKPALPPDGFKLSSTEWNYIQASQVNPDGAEMRRDYLLKLISDRDLPVYTRGVENSIRLCEDCRIIKPDRAHHCSTCGYCLLKMDHHCPWVNNCVGLHNYKYFVLFLLYGSLYCFYVGGSSAKYFISFWTEGVTDVQAFRFHVLFLFFASWMFSVSLLALGCYHLHLVLHNQTTLESFRPPVIAGGAGGPDKRAYHVGAGRNFRQVFGDRCALWLLPLHTWQQDGVVWEHRVCAGSPARQGYATMEEGTSGSPSRQPLRAPLLEPVAVGSPRSGNVDSSWNEIEASRR